MIFMFSLHIEWTTSPDTLKKILPTQKNSFLKVSNCYITWIESLFRALGVTLKLDFANPEWFSCFPYTSSGPLHPTPSKKISRLRKILFWEFQIATSPGLSPYSELCASLWSSISLIQHDFHVFLTYRVDHFTRHPQKNSPDSEK